MDQSSCSEFMLSRKDIKSKRIFQKDQAEKSGRWSQEQNFKYLLFLQFNRQKFECKKKRMFRLYKPLSKFIETRNSQQCRSHHRKLLQRFKSPKNIILNLHHQISKEEVGELDEKTIEKLKELQIPQKRIKKGEKLALHMKLKGYQNPNQYQNGPMQKEKIDEKQPQVRSERNFSTDLTVHSSNLVPMEQMTIMHYQVLNWLNQFYFSSYNYFYNPNSYCYLNSSLSFSGSQGNQ